MVVLKCSSLLIATYSVSQQNHIRSGNFLASLFYCTFRCCHLKENSKQNSKKLSMESSFYQQYQSRTIQPSSFLSDIVINYSLVLLHKQLPDAICLEDTEFGIQKKISKQMESFFQILHDVNYWLVVAGQQNVLAEKYTLTTL